MHLENVTDMLVQDMQSLRFTSPVSCVYNPLVYAREAYGQYVKRYGDPPKEVVLVGMNPGPWGMAQTGVPFGDVEAVRGWLCIEAPVGVPAKLHPKRPVHGYACKHREISGRRLWGWAEGTFRTPRAFFARFFVANYCPLLFLEKDGRNRTPDKLKVSERHLLEAACDRALRRTVECLRPRFVVGVGGFAEKRVRIALEGLDVIVGGITHPSPANPRANRGWEALVVRELAALGVG